MDVDEAEQEEELPPLTPAEAYMKRQSEIADAKKNIASICTNMLSSPEDYVSLISNLFINLLMKTKWKLTSCKTHHMA